MNSFDRISAAINHKFPDKVPKYEGTIEIPELNPVFDGQSTGRGLLFFTSKVIGRLNRHPYLITILRKILNHPKLLQPIAKFAPKRVAYLQLQYNYDMFSYTGGIPTVFTDKLFKDFHTENKDSIIKGKDGRLVWRTSVNGAHTRNGFLKTPEEWDKYIEFDSEHPANYFLIKPTIRVCKKLDIVPLFNIYGGAFFEELCGIFGFKTLFKLLIKEKEFIKKIVKDISEYSIAVAEKTILEGAKYLYITCDLGYKMRSFISPRMFNEFFKNYIKRFCYKVHKLNGKIIMHACGYVEEMIPHLIDMGIDALHPIEKAAGNDIVNIKKKYKKKLCLIGNVPIPLLTHGTPKETYEYVKYLLKNVSKYGGHIISSSHSITKWCKLKNFLAYQKAVEDFGKYPINVI
ncbi:MAG: uroporphyrinogen decarboxylase family protein [Promethearchaeota archaeon]